MSTHRTRLACIGLILAAMGLGACHRAERQAEQAAAQAAVKEAAATQAAGAFDDAVSAQNWPLAKAQGDVLLMQYPDTLVAQRVGKQMDGVRAKAAEVREAARTAALWNYSRVAVPGGTQVAATIDSQQPVDVDGSGAKPVQLVFRDHPSWGRSAYLVLQAGDFDCYRGCKVKVRVDDSASKSMAASRPKTHEAIAMFIEDERALWRMVLGARTLSIEFPVKAGGTRTAVFEVGGVDHARFPGWY
ncbi:hypothetical protein [Cognatiluteimonas profundi]|uniref:hypothetical protein n=1 Tax=Cognatiluteimonas profundi TaxID=2594501 RepID=UPI001E2B01B9|nr:hypothetical protein [Lysobacter profundi]